MSRTDLSNRIAVIEDELTKIDDQISALRRRKRKLLEDKETISRQISVQNTNDAGNAALWESDNFLWSKDCRQILENTFHLKDFRPLQRSVINSVLSNEDTIIIMSTGGGKSLCYQLPAVLLQGITIVVSPLISLIEDQILQLKKFKIEAATLNQYTTKEEVSRIQKALIDPSSSLCLLYVTPEKLAKSKRLMNQLEKCTQLKRLKLIAVDEVHCCSQWGYDYRPDYKFLNILKRQFKNVPLLGLTATASLTVIDDVKNILGIPAAAMFYSDFNRPNLFYEIRQKPSSSAEHTDELAVLIKERFIGQSGIIYCFTRKECEELAKALRHKGIRAAHYHAFMENNRRSQTHERWIQGEIQVIVATVAFGMGIDKPDVRFVIHHSMAKSIENYYQESGRAGRDGFDAVCILYFRLGDLFRQSSMVCTEKNGVSYLYVMLNYCLQRNLCRRSLFAELYNVEWDAALCCKRCDICANCAENELADVTHLWKLMLETLNECASKKDTGGRITGMKLAELVWKKGRRLPKEFIEAVLANLLLLQYFEEDFHFTPYNIISYVQPTSKSLKFAKDPTHKIEIHLEKFVSTNDKAKESRKRPGKE